MTPEARFWAKVHKSDGCWEWTAYRARNGYGQFGWSHNDIRLAHRVAYELSVGPIPAGLTLDHLCRNRACVNPAHLEPCTRGENTLRGEAPTALHARKTHCDHGHPFDEENTYFKKDGSRNCRACHRRHARETARRKRERMGEEAYLAKRRAETQASRRRKADERAVTVKVAGGVL